MASVVAAASTPMAASVTVLGGSRRPFIPLQHRQAARFGDSGNPDSSLASPKRSPAARIRRPSLSEPARGTSCAPKQAPEFLKRADALDRSGDRPALTLGMEAPCA